MRSGEPRRGRMEEYEHAVGTRRESWARANDRSRCLLWNQGTRPRHRRVRARRSMRIECAGAAECRRESFWSDAAAAMRHIGERKLSTSSTAGGLIPTRVLSQAPELRTEEILRHSDRDGGCNRLWKRRRRRSETNWDRDQLSYADWISSGDRVGISANGCALTQTQTATRRKAAEIPNYRPASGSKTLIQAGHPRPRHQDIGGSPA